MHKNFGLRIANCGFAEGGNKWWPHVGICRGLFKFEIRNSQSAIPTQSPRPLSMRGLSSLNADHLLQLGDDLYQIALVSHHLLDVLVGAGNFVQHAYVLATFNS
ncbi:MAG: hypothetical protein JWM21_3541 [Acidobacteria bacterium]|nr:hypothetical protein [Acidobacteriota bacterium]